MLMSLSAVKTIQLKITASPEVIQMISLTDPVHQYVKKKMHNVHFKGI